MGPSFFIRLQMLIYRSFVFYTVHFSVSFSSVTEGINNVLGTSSTFTSAQKLFFGKLLFMAAAKPISCFMQIENDNLIKQLSVCGVEVQQRGFNAGT